jgi:hypothetical protein
MTVLGKYIGKIAAMIKADTINKKVNEMNNWSRFFFDWLKTK